MPHHASIFVEETKAEEVSKPEICLIQFYLEILGNRAMNHLVELSIHTPRNRTVLGIIDVESVAQVSDENEFGFRAVSVK
jgi:hypothetical protein